jgi:glycogen operon protein
MLVSGDELARTQRGNNNTYCQNNEMSWQNWNVQPWQQELYDFTAYVIGIRRAHRVFQRDNFLTGEKVQIVNVPDIAWLNASAKIFSQEDWDSESTNSIGIYLAGAVNTPQSQNMVDNGFYWFLNASNESLDVVLPSAVYGQEYQLMFNTANESHSFDPQTFQAGESLNLESHAMALWKVTRRDSSRDEGAYVITALN